MLACNGWMVSESECESFAFHQQSRDSFLSNKTKIQCLIRSYAGIRVRTSIHIHKDSNERYASLENDWKRGGMKLTSPSRVDIVPI